MSLADRIDNSPLFKLVTDIATTNPFKAAAAAIHGFGSGSEGASHSSGGGLMDSLKQAFGGGSDLGGGETITGISRSAPIAEMKPMGKFDVCPGDLGGFSSPVFSAAPVNQGQGLVRG